MVHGLAHVVLEPIEAPLDCTSLEYDLHKAKKLNFEKGPFYILLDNNNNKSRLMMPQSARPLTSQRVIVKQW